ncbi:hypothetical protein V5O48_017277, partial [Marasmius crinis-equi]
MHLCYDPKIYDFDGSLIPPTSYSASIVDRQFMLAECYIKMWQFDLATVEPPMTEFIIWKSKDSIFCDLGLTRESDNWYLTTNNYMVSSYVLDMISFLTLTYTASYATVSNNTDPGDSSKPNPKPGPLSPVETITSPSAADLSLATAPAELSKATPAATTSSLLMASDTINIVASEPKPAAVSNVPQCTEDLGVTSHATGIAAAVETKTVSPPNSPKPSTSSDKTPSNVIADSPPSPGVLSGTKTVL